MSLDLQETNQISLKLTGKDGFIISEFKSKQIVTNLKELTTALKDMKDKLNTKLTDLVERNNKSDKETEGAEKLEENDDSDDDDENDKLSDVHVKKRKKTEPDDKTRAVKLKL